MLEINKNLLTKAWKSIYRHKSVIKRRYSRGIDGVTIKKFKEAEEANIEEITNRIQGGIFNFSKLKEYLIPRPGKSPRIIQAPCVKDRIVQKVMADYLGQKMHEEFSKNSVIGSIKGTKIKDELRRARQNYDAGYKYALKTDIINFFPSINVENLRNIFYSHFDEPFLNKLFEQYLDQTSRSGIPQGTPISPFMANLYLLELDKILSKNTEVRHFRYIDDLVVFCKTREMAEEIYEIARKYFALLNLSVHELDTPDKTMIDDFNAGTISILGVVMRNKKLLIKHKSYKNFIDSIILPIRYRTSLYSKKNETKKQISLEEFVLELNRTIIGWSSAYSFCDVQDEFRRLDQKIEKNFDLLMEACGTKPEDRKAIKEKIAKMTDAFKPRKRKKRKSKKRVRGSAKRT